MLVIPRRNFMSGLAGSFFGFATQFGIQQAIATPQRKEFRRCIVLWMNGGPSQFETFDPKPNTSSGGECGAIPTSVAGLQIAETLPNIAARMDQLCVLRSVTSTEGEHERASYYLHTGFKQVPSFPRPSMGSVVSHESSGGDLPKYVSIGAPGYGPAYMGLEHAPFSIENAAEARARLLQVRRKSGQLELMNSLGREFAKSRSHEAASTRNSMLQRMGRLFDTPFVDALNLEAESKKSVSNYGDHDFGKACLLARRLIEIGVPFVEVRHDGWDTHVENLSNVRRLCGQIDNAWSNLLDDLSARGLLDETLVVWMGEFGRTPTINGNAGRDHFPNVTPVVLAGCGVATGQVIGQTNRVGTEIQTSPVSVADLFATIYTKLGIDINQEFTTQFQSPTSVTDSGSPIADVG